MNRKERRAIQKEQHSFVGSFPEALTEIPPEDFPRMERMPLRAWKSRKYLVQMYEENNPYLPMLHRLSVCRVKLGGSGNWQAEITWDELQAIKSELGYGDWYGVEVYPKNANVVNVANIRHLWLMPQSLPIGWTKE